MVILDHFGHNMADQNFWSILVGLAVWRRLLGQIDLKLGRFWSAWFLVGFGVKVGAKRPNRPKSVKNWSINFAGKLPAKLARPILSQNRPKPTKKGRAQGWFLAA